MTVATPHAESGRGGVRALVELVGTVALAVGGALLVQAFLVKPYEIPSLSMFPTLREGQRILVSRLSTHPVVGDIVVFHPPAGATPPDDGQSYCGDRAQGSDKAQPCDQGTARESTETFVKRVVGLPADTIRISRGRVWRNGVEERGSYIQPCTRGPGAAPSRRPSPCPRATTT